jgi:hypothetical protein
MSITSHFSYNPFLDRPAAETFVNTFKYPVVRPSSIQGHYAVSYLNSDGKVVHTLLRETHEKKIECVNIHGQVIERYDSINSVLLLVYPSAFQYGAISSYNPCIPDPATAASCDPKAP